MQMKIGIIGSGGIGQAFARQVLKAGYEVIMSNSRGADSLKEIVKQLGSKARAGTVEDAVGAEVIFLAVQWVHLPAVAKQISNWAGKIVIDPINPVVPPDYKMAELAGRASSEVIQEMLAGAKLVKAFNTFTPPLLQSSPEEKGGKRVVFYCGDDEAAKTIVKSIIDAIGFAGIDLGTLKAGAYLQQYPSGPLPGLNLIKL
ncbi:MAG: NAD(P)-binding domain-containing protein [Cyclobacteriaceae bacterium]|nr:NAD(P)-binding domain-containing protein [Cyclobacteriaceae bacterium]